MSLDLLKTNFKRKVTPESELKEEDMCFYSYMLYVLGANLFCDKGGFNVFMINLTDICKAQKCESIGKIT